MVKKMSKDIWTICVRSPAEEKDRYIISITASEL